MKKVRERNKLCYCGSGKKIKQCCLTEKQKLIKQDLDKQKEHQDWESWCERVSKGSFFAEIRSTDGDLESSSMKVMSSSIINNGVKTTLFDDEITLSVNSVNDYKTGESSAIFIVPQDNKKSAKIKISGNASVINNKEYYNINIINNKKELKCKSNNGLSATLRIGKQRDGNFDFFDVIFGLAGKKEIVNSKGVKNRPHVAFYPNGNGKFIRLSDYLCEFESELGYCPKNNDIFPSKLTICVKDFSEKLVLSFKFDSQLKKVILEHAYFE